LLEGDAKDPAQSIPNFNRRMRITEQILVSISPSEAHTNEQSGEPDAVQSLVTYKHRLARSLAALVNVLDPDVIILGGGISNLETLCVGLPELIAKYAFSDGIRTRFVRAAHGDSKSVRGAAWLWPIKKA
jgi:predicted NBD/HSP70 family sugar kinase